MAEKTSIAVIGGGPGGYVAAIRAAQLGAAVTLIEKNVLGGTCLNVGCIPTKALLHGAEVYAEALGASAWGVEASVTLNFPVMRRRKDAVVKKLVGGVQGLLRSNNVSVIKGEARFKGPGALVVTGADGERAVPFDSVIIASGAVPVLPPIPGINAACCVDSSGALAFASVPESLVIIGGGVIGVEIATLYATLGCKVSLIEMMEEILPAMDGELVAMLRADLVRRGIAIYTAATVTAVEENNGGGVVHVRTVEGEKALQAEKVLVCVGRRPATENLGLETLGIVVNRGRIITDDRMRTNVPGVYAIGDCANTAMLAHTASAQGEIAAENALGRDIAFSDKTNPSCVYSMPELAGVGLTEREAREQIPDCLVGRFPLAANGRALIMNGGRGMVKIIAEKRYGEILGVHIYGPRATDLIAEAALAVGMEACLEEVVATIHAHPTLSEAVREAALAAENRAVHLPGK